MALSSRCQEGLVEARILHDEILKYYQSTSNPRVKQLDKLIMYSTAISRLPTLRLHEKGMAAMADHGLTSEHGAGGPHKHLSGGAALGPHAKC